MKPTSAKIERMRAENERMRAKNERVRIDIEEQRKFLLAYVETLRPDPISYVWARMKLADHGIS